MLISEIPLSATNQQFSINLSGTVWQLRIIWRDVAGWVLDLQNSAGDAVVSGIPLIPGVDLLAQYGYLQPGGKLVLLNNSDELPGTDELGGVANLYWITG
ncbi:phage baseplate plug family protein [Mixta intestinalis]|uniref:Cyanophage baseplate Pam3 plug gp18 domain-containing protein n=1 Tax=Mixta intestinalis TaxID=1615494 RepID=A0A6P1PYU2_9GAMM|nr:hypothetical protein [Mixta intestinalis]QHM71272.1 hypothetical protein C7M51_01558 [Mixta intestinalis]